MRSDRQTRFYAVWRIIVGISLIPAFGTLYQRLTLPEAPRFIASQKLSPEEEGREKEDDLKKGDAEAEVEVVDEAKKAHFTGKHNRPCPCRFRFQSDPLLSQEFLVYFSEWRHAKILIGTCMCWFLLDIAYAFNLDCVTSHLTVYLPSFYGINLNQNVVLLEIGYAGKTGNAWQKLFKVSTGGIIITALGFVPGQSLVSSLKLFC